MKKFFILLSAGTAFAFASCSSSGGCCDQCQTSDSKTECVGCTGPGGTCTQCASATAG